MIDPSAVTHEMQLGDCLDPVSGLASLPDKSIDITVTDPPYGEHVHGKFAAAARPENGLAAREEITFSPLSSEERTTVFREIARVTKRWIVAFTCDREIGSWQACEGAEYIRQGAWLKTDKTPQMTGDRPAQGLENLLLWHGLPRKGRMRWNGGGRAMLYTGPAQEWNGSTNLRVHPTQKPLWLIEAILRDFTNPGDLVIDPYCGSGTTGVAAKRLGRRFLGWEKAKGYAEIAQARIGMTREQLALWEGAA